MDVLITADALEVAIRTDPGGPVLNAATDRHDQPHDGVAILTDPRGPVLADGYVADFTLLDVAIPTAREGRC